MGIITEPERRTPVTAQYDVAVVGGGVAGIASALAAARRGVSVCIIEKENMLGGLATLALIAIYLPLCDGCGTQVIFGLGEELLRLSIKYGGGRNLPDHWLGNGTKDERVDRRYMLEYNPWLFAIAAEELLAAQGVTLLYDSRFCGVSMQGDAISALIVENKQGRQAIRAKTVVDASGDADVCNAAGAQTAVYRHNRLAAWHYTASTGQSTKLHTLAVPLYGALPAGERLYDGLNAKDLTQISVLGRRWILADILRRRAETGDAGIEPTALPMIPSVRMTRRLVGLWELDESEEGMWHDDAVGLTGDWRNRGPVFSIPYRCLYAGEVTNLLAAGRCISVTDAMWDITRVIPTCAVTGEAAGAAAALTVSHSKASREINIRELQKSLEDGGVRLQKSLLGRK